MWLHCVPNELNINDPDSDNISTEQTPFSHERSWLLVGPKFWAMYDTLQIQQALLQVYLELFASRRSIIEHAHESSFVCNWRSLFFYQNQFFESRSLDIL